MLLDREWSFYDSTHGLTFTWWRCCGLCFWHKPTELAHSFLFCSCVYFCLMVLSAVFHFIKSPDNSLLSHSVLPVLFLPAWSFQLYISLWKVSFSPDIILCGWLGLKHQLTNQLINSRFGKCPMHEKFGSLSPGKASYDRVALPSLNSQLALTLVKFV